MGFRLLGPLEVGAGARVRGARERKLLALLLLEAPAAVPRRAIEGWVLGHDAAPDATMHVAVARLRRQLRDHDVPASINRTPTGLRLVTELDSIDSVHFTRLVARARALRADEPTRLRRLREALALWRGDVLDGEHVPHHRTAAELIELRFSALEECFADPVLAGDPAGMAELLGWCRDHPERERLWALAMLGLYRSGRHVDALALFQEARSRLVDTLGLEPGPDLVDLERRILRHDPALVAPRLLRGPSTPLPEASQGRVPLRGGSLPQPPTSFVGRVAELDRLAAALPCRRAVTLVGPGGVGKTRLAIEAAAAVSGEFTDGVWFLDLARLGGGVAVLHAVASVMAIKPQPGQTVAASIVEWIAPKRLLVVLDNCEHVIDAVAGLVASIVAVAPGAAVLSSSREPLGVEGEHIWVVAPLAPRREAVELFCERAQAADQSFSPSEADLDLIGTVCERLDGMPLAVELAASRVRSMPLPQLADRLSDRFSLLRASSRDARPQRHQTLRATVEWSYDLLSDDERLLFERLSVFADPFDVDAAEAVCGDDPLDRGEVADLLSRLVDRSLVVLDRGPVPARYRLLETLRAYGMERLVARGERDRVLDAHLAHVTTAVVEAQRSFEGAALAAGVERYRAYWDELRVAVDVAVERGDDARANLLVSAPTMFACFWFRFEVGEWAQRLIRHGMAGPAAYGAAALFAAFSGDRQAMHDLGRRGLALTDGDDDPAGLQCWHSLVTAHALTHGGAEAATESARRMVACAERLPASRSFWRAYAHLVLAWMQSILEPGQGSESLEAGIDAAASLRNGFLDGYGELVAGHLAAAAGDREKALDHFEAVAAIAEATGSPHLAAMVPWSIAHVAPALGDPDAAISAFRTAIRALYDARDWAHLWPVTELLAGWCARGPDPVLAAVILGHLDTNGITMIGYEAGRGRASTTLAGLASTATARARGRRFSRDQLILHVLNALERP